MTSQEPGQHLEKFWAEQWGTEGLNASKMPADIKIDVHSHFLPPFYREACLETGHGKPDGMPALPVGLSPKQLSRVRSGKEADLRNRSGARRHTLIS